MTTGALPRCVLARAAHWHVELCCGSADPQAHAAWLAESGDHARAWALLGQVDEQLKTIPSTLSLPALQAAQQQRRAAARLLAMLVASAGGIALGQMGLESSAWQSWTAALRTAPGERRRVTLADGGSLQLNTDSAADVDYSGTHRRLRLHRGEIMVTTAPDARPFLVETAHGVIRALGTRFGVRCDAQASSVTVFEHAVEVRNHAAPGGGSRVEAGQQLRFSRLGDSGVQTAPRYQDSWTRGMLVAVDWPLSRLVAELARYRRGHLACEAGVADKPVTGTYRLADIDAALESLCVSHGLQVTYLTRFWGTVGTRRG
ncbi:FecR domain-containing protein [Janthinobacterium psychrotolerans]|uniref:Transmembrane sensor n=1 Tax=Janthinobacterium psychrotolerans TaxID=1747903 RepID=A0A1A7BXL9_9BURK|nr:FecR domain-containing protein [Janthinobacterium psychrotolerans]OBV38351.1 transmembrane sensor [Janthinobacterium psychrotolerans]